MVTAVPCAKKHAAEVFFSANYWPTAMAFPGNAAVYRQAKRECSKAFRTYDGGPYSASQYSYEYISPQGRPDWNSGDRQLVCIAFYWTSKVPRGKPLFASIKGSNQ